MVRLFTANPWLESLSLNEVYRSHHGVLGPARALSYPDLKASPNFSIALCSDLARAVQSVQDVLVPAPKDNNVRTLWSSIQGTPIRPNRDPTSWVNVEGVNFIVGHIAKLMTATKNQRC